MLGQIHLQSTHSHRLPKTHTQPKGSGVEVALSSDGTGGKAGPGAEAKQSEQGAKGGTRQVMRRAKGWLRVWTEGAGGGLRCVIGQMRTPAHQLRIGTSRYKSQASPAEKRLCQICQLEPKTGVSYIADVLLNMTSKGSMIAYFGGFWTILHIDGL